MTRSIPVRQRCSVRTNARAGAALLALLLAACAGLSRSASEPQNEPAQGPAAEQSPAAPVGIGTGPTTLIIVRHAQRADGGGERDPELSELGAERAEALADALEHAGVGSIFTTQYLRTRRTAEPLAGRLGIPVATLEIGQGGIEAYLTRLREVVQERAGETILIVGHSNTVPAIVSAFSGRTVPALSEHEYGTLDVVTLLPSDPQQRPARLLRLRW